MRVAALQYELPGELIARHPTTVRDESRLLVVSEAGFRHERFRAVVDLVPPGALLVVNDTRVFPARLVGHKIPTGGKAELLLVERMGPETIRGAAGDVPGERWSALGRATGRLRSGLDLAFGPELRARVAGPRDAEGLLPVVVYGRRGGDVGPLVERAGTVPLPPYLGRAAEPADRDRYQTVYARTTGAVAAPTAGLHFTESVFAQLAAKDVHRAAITLHVGPGTFRPVAVSDLDQHRMHVERFWVPAQTVSAIAAARADGRPVVAVGTTVVRALETAADPDNPGRVRPVAGQTRLLIQPGHRFQVVDSLITNFHLPGSTLLALVYAFGGTELVRAAYREAIAERYRFYSYGDAMYLPRCVSRRLP